MSILRCRWGQLPGLARSLAIRDRPGTGGGHSGSFRRRIHRDRGGEAFAAGQDERCIYSRHAAGVGSWPRAVGRSIAKGSREMDDRDFDELDDASTWFFGSCPPETDRQEAL
jgi:hypothetical protein